MWNLFKSCSANTHYLLIKMQCIINTSAISFSENRGKYLTEKQYKNIHSCYT